MCVGVSVCNHCRPALLASISSPRTMPHQPGHLTCSRTCTAWHPAMVRRVSKLETRRQEPTDLLRACSMKAGLLHVVLACFQTANLNGYRSCGKWPCAKSSLSRNSTGSTLQARWLALCPALPAKMLGIRPWNQVVPSSYSRPCTSCRSFLLVCCRWHGPTLQLSSDASCHTIAHVSAVPPQLRLQHRKTDLSGWNILVPLAAATTSLDV